MWAMPMHTPYGWSHAGLCLAQNSITLGELV